MLSSSAVPPARGATDAVAHTEPDVRRRGSVGWPAEEHPRAADAALAVGVVALGLVTSVLGLATVEGSTGLGLFRPDEPVAQVVVTAWLAGAVLGAALLLSHRTRPLVVTAALTALAVASLATAGVLRVLGVCLACAVHAVAASRQPRTAWLTCGAVLVVVTVATWWSPSATSPSRPSPPAAGPRPSRSCWRSCSSAWPRDPARVPGVSTPRT